MLSVAIAAAALAGCDANPSPPNAVEEPRANAPSKPTRAIVASFDCDRARGQAQELVCGDANLAAMDREVARLTSLAMEPAAQTEWVQQRDSCDKADLLRECVMAAAALKIHHLRKGSDVARGSEGLSVGPVAFTCRGIGEPVLATFVNSDPGAVALEWDGQAMAIDRVVAASGARYEGRWDGGSYSFWNKGREATLTVPGKGDLQCVEMPSAD
jgi:membrane-bound inhibitor of C-type lysozyme